MLVTNKDSQLLYVPASAKLHNTSSIILPTGSINDTHVPVTPHIHPVALPPQAIDLHIAQEILSTPDESDQDSENPDHVDFSGEVRERIKKPQRTSTRSQYDARVQIFKTWCRENQVSTSRPPHNKVADFFQYLFNVRGHQPRSIVGFRTALFRFL